MGAGSYLWHGVVTATACGLGPLSRRALGLDRLLRMDLGQQRSLGLGPLSLRAVVHERGLRVVLVSGRNRIWSASLLEPRAGGVRGIRARRRRIWPCGLGSAGA